MSTTLAPAVGLDTLCALFAGDDLTRGHPTLELAVAICTHVEPVSVMCLKDAIYGEGWPNDEIPWAEREVMARGYAAWATRRR